MAMGNVRLMCGVAGVCGTCVTMSSVADMSAVCCVARMTARMSVRHAEESHDQQSRRAQ